MKIDFLDDVTDNGKYPWADPAAVVRFTHFSEEEIRQLRKLIEQLIHSEIESINFGSLPFVELDNCILFFLLSETDEGIRLDNNRELVCRLTPSGYAAMNELLEPYESPCDGFQWLYDLNCDIDLLISYGGGW